MAHIEEITNGLTVALLPTPSFVVKTKVVALPERSLNGTTYSLDQKIFLNVCSNERVPLPPTAFNPSETFPLIMDNTWEIPIIVSRERTATDKKGVVCYVYDCIINDTAMAWVHADTNLRMIVVEWCLESVEYHSQCGVSREYTVPKMKFKGEIVVTNLLQSELAGRSGMQREVERLREDTMLGLIQESREEEEDDALPPLFPQAATPPTNKPLIQEISALTLGEKPMEAPLPVVKRLQFTVSFHKLQELPYRLEIKIANEHLRLASAFRLTYLQPTHSLEVQSSVTSLVVANNTLVIPLPTDMGADMVSFYVQEEATLCVFLK